MERAGRKGQEKASTYALVMVTIGAVRVPVDGREFDDVFRLADKALYNVKQNGKHGYAFYQKSGDEKSKEQQEAEQGSLPLSETGEPERTQNFFRPDRSVA